MLLWLDASLASVHFAGDPQSLSGLENLLLSCFNGNHLLVGDRATIKALRAIVTGRREVSVLDKIYNQLPELIGFTKTLDFRVRVTDTSAPEGWAGTERTIWLSRFAHLTPFCTVLLAENLIDANLYIFAARHYVSHSRTKGVNISLEPRGGGGNTISVEFENIAKHFNHFCICVTDSDRLTPHCSPSDTAKQCAKISNTSNWIVCHHCLDARELENIIPLTCYEQSLDAGSAAKIEKILEITTVSPNVRDFLDIKDGSVVRSIFAFPVASPKRQFWEQAIETINAAGLAEIPCLGQGQCSNPETCVCVVHSGLGRNALSQVLHWLNSNSIPKTLEAFRGAEGVSWLAIGKKIYEWGVAQVPTRI